MYAPGQPPTAPRRVPSRAWIVSMRVLFTALAVCSCGMLLWAPLLRLAFVRRRAADWWVSGAGFVLALTLLLVIGRDGEEAHGVDFVFIPMLFLAMAAAAAYYLVADIRHYAQLTRQNTLGGHLPPGPGYAYAPTAPMQTPMPSPRGQPLPPHPYPQQPYQQPQPPAQQPHSTPQPQPHPQRIDQVRAELDELSDYLRKEEGR